MGNLQSYRFKGVPAEGTGRTLDEAIMDLSNFWNSRPTLVSHNWGVLTLQITVGSTPVVIEVTNPDILDDLSVGDTSSLVAQLAKDMQLDLHDTEMLLSETTDVVATVDRLRPPDGSGMVWQPDPSLSPDVVMPRAAVDWLADVGQEADMQSRRDQGGRRSKRSRDLLRLVVSTGLDQGMSDRQISSRTRLPVSTVRDTRERIDREKRVSKQFKGRKRGQRYTSEQRRVVEEVLSDTDGNAAEAARRLGLPSRTVRDLKRSIERAPEESPKKTLQRRSYSESDRDELLDLVKKEGVSATEAGRRLGVSGRTARGWVRQAKLDSIK